MTACLTGHPCAWAHNKCTLQQSSVFSRTSPPMPTMGGMGVPYHAVEHKQGAKLFRSSQNHQHRVHLRWMRPVVRASAGKQDAGPAILVNSCTGKMGHATAEAVVRAGLTLIPYTFTGRSEAVAVGNVGVCGVPVELITQEERQSALERIKKEYPNLVVIDYTLPSAVNDNAIFYCENQLPFVMGTTGGDREKLLEDAQKAGVYAVIAPNMGKQIVAFQTMMESMAEQFPGCFKGYTLRVVESHQRTKADTSGTAKAVVQSFQKMGLDFEERDIEKVRQRENQMFDMGVPEEHIDGHAFHTYTLTSEDGSVTLEFKHNVCGREVYAEGTVDAAIFLYQQKEQGASKKVYNMIDVLKAGAMR